MDLYESFMCNDDIMTMCNPFSIYYIVEYARKDPKLVNLHRYQSGQMSVLTKNFFKMRLEIKKHFLDNPCFTTFEGLTPANAVDNEWVEIVGNFSEAIADNLIFIRAIQVETTKKFKDLF